jgi:hypothetical protein
VRLNKRTETAIDRYDSEIGRFLCLSSSKKGLDIETIFLAEKVGFYGFFIECIRSEPLSQRCVALAKSMVCLCWHLHEVTVVQATKMGA